MINNKDGNDQISHDRSSVIAVIMKKYALSTMTPITFEKLLHLTT